MVNIDSLQQSKVSSSTLIEDEDIEQVVGKEAKVFFSNKARLITQSETAAVHIDPISTTSVFYY